MKTKEEILESYFGSDYYILKRSDDLHYILAAMDEYANQFISQEQPQQQTPPEPLPKEAYLPFSIFDFPYPLSGLSPDNAG